MSDIVTRLRDWRDVHLARLHLLMDEAADEMERLSKMGDCPGRDNAANEDNLLAEVRRLRAAIAALAGQDATLSVCEGNVIVTMDATLTVEERAVISFASDAYALNDDDHDCWRIANTLRGLLERL